jgi:glycerol-3-phosphate dehydrogenase
MPNVEFENEFDVQADTHSVVFDHSKKGSIKNLISIKSVKYTTAPSIAKDILRIMNRKLNTSPNKLEKNYKELENDYDNIKKIFFSKNKNYDAVLLERLWNTYGIRSQNVTNFIEQNEQTKKIIIEKEKIFLGEIKYNINEEMAITLSDIIDRRLGLTAFEEISELDKLKIKNALKQIVSKDIFVEN